MPLNECFFFIENVLQPGHRISYIHQATHFIWRTNFIMSSVPLGKHEFSSFDLTFGFDSIG